MTGISFFDLQGTTYVGRDPARGPWSGDHCHAGPVAGALARSFEQAFGPDKQLIRLTVDLIRPVPMAGFDIHATLTRSGRRLGTATGELAARDGRICATATAMAIAPGPGADYPTAPVDQMAALDAARPGVFPVAQALHDLPFITNFVDILYPPGQDGTPGPTTLWMRTPPLLAGENPSPFQRLCPLADCGNAIGRNEDIGRVSFLNSDLTIVAHRASSEDWLQSAAHAHWHDTGIGLAQARISDSQGPIATALQSLLLETR